MFHASFFKISSGPLMSLHQLNYPWTTSNSLKLTKILTPRKSPWPTFQAFLISLPWHPCSTGSSYGRLTFGPYPKSKRLNGRVYMGAHGRYDSWCWPRQQRIKSQWPLRPTKLPKQHSVFLLTPTFSRLRDHLIPDFHLCDHRTQLQAKNQPPFREFFIGGVLERLCQKGRTMVLLKGQLPSRFPPVISLFFAWLQAYSLFSVCTCLMVATGTDLEYSYTKGTQAAEQDNNSRCPF